MKELPIIIYEGEKVRAKESIEQVMRHLGYRNFRLIVPKENKK